MLLVMPNSTAEQMPLPVMPIFLIVNAACDINFDYF
jgi:hypothetical protein